MSRLIDTLNKVARVTAQPMGFGTNRAAAAGSRMLLVAGLAPSGDVTGADAVLLRQDKPSLTAAALKKAVDALPKVPWGSLAGANDKKTSMLVEAGCDFLVFTGESPVISVPQDEKVGRVLQVETSLDDGLLRTLNNLPVDAVLAGGEALGDSLDWQSLMQLQRLSNLLSMPLLVAVLPKVTEAEIKALWEAGVDGVIAGAEGTGGLQELRRIIDGLPSRNVRRRGKNEAMVPRLGLQTSAAEEGEEEDDDWDDE